MKIEELEIEQELDKTTRPDSFDSFIGQKTLIKQLKISIEAAKGRGSPLCSIMLSGKSGYGKSTLGSIIANEYGAECKIIMAPSIKNVSDILETLVKITKNSFLILEECHQLNEKVTESLYSAIQDFKISIRTANKNVVHIPMEPFCLIGTTNQLGKVSEPLRNRFGIVAILEDYTLEELVEIVKRNAIKIGVELESEEIAYNIAKRSRNTPRLINRLLARIADVSQLYYNNFINKECVDKAMTLEKIDENGLTDLDLSYLRSLYKNFGGSAGIQPLASTLSVDRSYLEEYIEPVLVKNEFIVKSKVGRVITEKGLRYILE